MRSILAFTAIIAIFSSLTHPAAGQEPLAFEEVVDGWQADEVEANGNDHAVNSATFALHPFAFSSTRSCCNDAWAGYCEEQQGCCGFFSGGLRCRLAIWKDQIFGSRCSTCCRCECRSTSCECTTDASESDWESESDDVSYSQVHLLTPPPSQGADRVAVMHTARGRGTAEKQVKVNRAGRRKR